MVKMGWGYPPALSAVQGGSMFIVPVPGQVYTLRVILTNLELDDSPFFTFQGDEHDKEGSVIQTSHITTEQLLSIPGFGDTRWRYIRTTDEWIPIFFYAGPPPPITDFVDMEPDNCGDGWWVTPKGFPREQYVWKEDVI